MIRLVLPVNSVLPRGHREDDKILVQEEKTVKSPRGKVKDYILV